MHYKQLNLQKRDIFYKPYTFAYQYEDHAIKIILDNDYVFIIPSDVYIMIADHEGFVSIFNMQQMIEFYKDIKIVVLNDNLDIQAKRIKDIEQLNDVVTHAPFEKLTMIGIDDQSRTYSLLISDEIPKRIPKDCHFVDIIS